MISFFSTLLGAVSFVVGVAGAVPAAMMPSFLMYTVLF
jgi:hypothetical protein